MDERRLKDERFYIRVDIGFWDHPKAIAAGPDGRNLYLCALAWSRSQLTDGAIPATSLPLLAFKVGIPIDAANAAADRLIEVGMWDRTPDGWAIHDYAEHQLTREDIDKVRAQWRGRQATSRARKKDQPDHVDVTRDNGVSHARVTSPESETETEKKSLSSTDLLQQGYPQPSDDDETRAGLALAEVARTLSAAPGKRNPAGYRRTVIANAPDDGRLAALADLARAHPTRDPTWLADEHLGRTHPPDQCANCRGLYHTADRCPLKENP
jgi:hypothetical protein